MADSLILMVMALVVFGPRRLPQIGRQIGKLMYEFRKVSNDFKYQMEEEFRAAEDADRRKKEAEALAARATAPGINAEAAQLPSPQSTVESPYSTSPYAGEERYPATPSVEIAENETTPRIMPPATGLPVEAIRSALPVEAIDPDLPAEAIPPYFPKETATPQSPSEIVASEPVTHHD
jgi:sec-independent protein translocase protein TatB